MEALASDAMDVRSSTEETPPRRKTQAEKRREKQ